MLGQEQKHHDVVFFCGTYVVSVGEIGSFISEYFPIYMAYFCLGAWG
jgi:hypothetical protein